MKLWSLIWCNGFTAELCTWQKVLQPSTMGRYPVHRHRLPEKQHCVLGASASLISRCNLPLNTELAAFVTDFKAETRERTGQSLCDVVHAGLRLVPQQSVHGHHHSWSAEATLGAVSLRYPLLPSNRHSVKQFRFMKYLWNQQCFWLDVSRLQLYKLYCWDEWRATLTCTGWILVLVLPIPSTVVTAAPWSWQIGRRQALTA